MIVQYKTKLYFFYMSRDGFLKVYFFKRKNENLIQFIYIPKDTSESWKWNVIENQTKLHSQKTDISNFRTFWQEFCQQFHFPGRKVLFFYSISFHPAQMSPKYFYPYFGSRVPQNINLWNSTRQTNQLNVRCSRSQKKGLTLVFIFMAWQHYFTKRFYSILLASMVATENEAFRKWRDVGVEAGRPETSGRPFFSFVGMTIC